MGEELMRVSTKKGTEAFRPLGTPDSGVKVSQEEPPPTREMCSSTCVTVSVLFSSWHGLTPWGTTADPFWLPATKCPAGLTSGRSHPPPTRRPEITAHQWVTWGQPQQQGRQGLHKVE